MSLAGWQAALTQLVHAHAAARSLPVDGEAMNALALTASERDSLARAIGSPGLRVTCTIQRSWRAACLRTTACLTLTSLPARLRESLLEDWLVREGDASFFYASEVEAFLKFVLARTTGPTHVLCRFELAAHRALSSRNARTPQGEPSELRPESLLSRHRAADLVYFWAPPLSILSALSRGLPLPRGSRRRFPMLVAPGVPELARLATDAQALVWEGAATTASFADLTSIAPDAEEAVRELLETSGLVAGGSS